MEEAGAPTERDQHVELRELFGTSDVGILIFGADGVLREANTAAMRILDLDRDELVARLSGAVPWPIVHEDGSPFALEDRPSQLVLRTGEPEAGTVMGVPRRDGTRAWTVVAALPLRSGDDDVTLTGVAVSFSDITPLVDAQQREHELGLLAEHTTDLIARLSADGTIRYCSAASLRLLGRRSEDLVGANLGEIAAPDDAPLLADMLARVQHGARGERLSFRVEHADGRAVWCEGSFHRLAEDGSGPSDVVVDLRDISERKRVERRLEYQTLHDPLTGLPNRILFNDRLSQALLRSRRSGESVAVMFVDLDRFKLINDSLGHSAGDRTLVTVGQRVRSVLRPGDSVARFGGDEFVLLCENDCSPEEAQVIAARIATAISSQPVVSVPGQREVSITASIGIALSGGHDRTAAELLSNADAAMYRAKEDGRARFELFTDEMRAGVANRLVTENDLRRAITRGQLRLFYQPIVSLRTGAPAALEALVRWQHPVRGLVPPDEFIPVAEDTELIVPIGTWVVAEAARQVKAWRAVGSPCGELPVAINLSARQFADPDLVGVVTRPIQEAGLDPAGFILEVTETVIMKHAGTTLETLERLRSHGLRVSIDDFGTGYSSLAYLSRLPVSELKVDRSFVERLGEGDDDDAIVTAVLSLAQALGIEVVAEGVETAEQLATLRALGCDFVQGFMLARPTPPGELDRVLLQAAAAGG